MVFLESLHAKGFVIVVVGPHCGGGQVFREQPGSKDDLCAILTTIV